MKFLTEILAKAGITSNYFKLDTSATPPIEVGKVVWNAADGTFDMGLLNNVTLQAGQELHFYGKAVGAISNGQAVMFAGAQGDHALMTLADAATINANPEYFIGVATQDFANNQFGYVTVLGKVRGLNTSAYTAGDLLYYNSTSATDGLLTATMPSAPNAKILVAAVLRVHANEGILLVRPHTMPKISDIQDVSISSLANNNFFVYDSATSVWKNKTIAAALGYTPANDSNVVKLTGDQTVAGAKTFTSVINASTLSINGGTLVGNNIVSMRSNPTGGQFRIEKSDGSLSAYPFYIGVDGTALAYYYNASGALKVLLHTNDTSYFGNSLSVGYSTYASTSYMLDINGTARFVGALTGTSATFTNPVTIGNYDGQALKLQSATSTGSSYLRFYNSAAASRGYLGLFWNGTSDYMVFDAGALEMNFGSSNKFTFTGGGTAIFSGAITANSDVTISTGSIKMYSVQNAPGQYRYIGTEYAAGNGNNKAEIRFGIDGSDTRTKITLHTANGGGQINEVLGVFASGQFKLNNYTASSSFSGTAAGYLAFDSSGNVITVAGVASTVTAGFSLTTQGAANNTPSTPSVNAGVYAGVYAFIDLATQNENGGWIDFSKGDGSDFAGRIRYYANPERFGFHTAGGAEKITFDASGNIALVSGNILLGGGSSSSQSTLASGLTAIRFPNQYSSGYTDAGVKLYIFNSGTTIQGFTAGPAYDLQYHSSGSDSGRHAFYVANSEIIRFSKTIVGVSGILQMSTSGTSYISMGRFPNSVSNSGEAWLGRASDRSTGSMTVQLGGSSNASFFEVVDYGWTTVTLKVGMNDFSYKGNAVIHAGNIGSYTAGSSQQVTINYNNDSNSTYQLLWGSGNSVYGTSQVYVNPSSDVIYARGGYISPSNPWGTSDSAFFPNGITTAGSRNWIYGATYIGNAPGNGQGVDIGASGNAYFRSNVGTSSHGSSARFLEIQSGAGNFIPYSFESEYGNHSWGTVMRIRINQSGADRPSIQFSSASNDNRWNVGYCYNDDNFRVTQNMAYRNDNSTTDGWGTERFRINTDGNTYAAIGGTLYANGTQVVTNNGGTWNIAISGNAGSASAVAWSNVSGKPQDWLNQTNLISSSAPNTLQPSGFYQDIGGGGNPVGTWFNYINVRHSNPANGHGYELGMSYYDNDLWFRSYQGSGSFQSWAKAISSQNIGSQSVNYANSAGSLSSMNISQFTNNSGYQTNSGQVNNLSTNYAGGVQTNPQVYFNNSVGLKVAMTGYWSVWSDTMWVNGYAGGDVPWMCALHFLRNSEPRFAISAQTQGSTSYGSVYEVITSYNIANQTVANLSGFDKTNPSFGAVYASNWFRAQGDCGLYSQDYGGHIRRALTGSYGNWETFGYNRNGWSGFLNLNNYNLNLMMNSSGDHGFYIENGPGWTFFFNRGNHCAGIGTDNTWSGDGLRVVKQISAEYGFTTWSDRRAKENITNITSALDKVLQMRGVYFNYIKDDAKVKRVGFIAQELQEVLPEVVNYADEIDEYNVNYGQIVSVLTEATKEQNDMIVSQATRIEQLELLVQQLINSNNGISN